MTNIDVFSGDADGLCGLHQFRLTYRIDSTLLTGVKRDTKLLDRVDANSSGVVSTFNVPVGTNREALFRLLGLGVQCTCFDGHFKGIVRQHPGLALMVDQAAEALPAPWWIAMSVASTGRGPWSGHLAKA